MEEMHHTLMENLITVLCHSEDHGRVVAHMLDTNLMEGDYRLIAERAIKYWNDYDEPPRDHTVDLVADLLTEQGGNRRTKTFQRILSSMAQLAESMNTKFVMEQLRIFTRLQRLKDAVLKSAEKLNANQQMAIGEIEEIWNDLLRQTSVGFESGMVLNEIERTLDYLETHASEFILGIKELDARGLVPARGQVLLLLAPAGVGKSWFLVNVGKQASLLRKRVLHVTLEMSEEQTVMRYYMALFAIAKRPGKQSVSRLVKESDDDDEKAGFSQRLVELDAVQVEPELTFEDTHIRDELRSRMEPYARRYSNMIVKRYPPRSLSMNGLRTYLDLLYQTEGFVPDICILDYVGITKTDADNHRISLGRNMEEFRAIMVERNMAGVTVHQVQRAGAMADTVRSTHVAEDWSLIATADIALTYSATTQERELGLARIFVDKGRDERDKFTVLITQNYGTGQFCLESMMMDSGYWKLLKEQAGDDEEDEDE